jgi:hypothetical protein
MPGIEDVVERIRDLEQRREQVGEELAELDLEAIGSSQVREDGFIHDVEPADVDGSTVAGVDGGVIQKEFHGIDVVLTRAVGAIFSYDGSGLETSSYVPERSPRPEVTWIESPLDRQEFNLSTSLLRLQKEIEAARQALEQDPDMLLLDGSIVPQYTDRPASDDYSRTFYDDLIESYRSLFEEAIERDILLAGVIEDSRGTRLCESLAGEPIFAEDAREVLEASQDTNMLSYALGAGERTPVMAYTEEYEKHPTLQDLGEVGEDVYNIYLRTARDDRPVRVDFLARGDPVETAEEVAARIMPLCSFSSTYGIPSVLIEADQRAKLSQQDLELFESRLRSVVGPMPGIEDLRRDSRPF